MSTIYLQVEMAVASRDFAVLHSGLASRLTTRSRPSTELDMPASCAKLAGNSLSVGCPKMKLPRTFCHSDQH